MIKRTWLRTLTALSLLGTLAACGGSESPAPVPPATAESDVEPMPADGSEEAEDPKDTEADDTEADERAARLAAAREELAAKAEAENARWTDDIREQARALAETRFETFAEAVEAATESDHRMPGHADRDPHRRPAETLTFFGLEPDMTVLEYSPGGGWYTELLAPALSPEGRLLVTAPDVDDPETSFLAYYAERLDMVLDRSPELFGDVERVTYDPDAPDLGLSGEVDAALMIRGMHGRARDGDLDAWLATIHDALAPGGVFAVVQHRADPEADPETTAPMGYLPEPWVIEQVEAAGFELAESSELNANPKDTRDHERGVWTLPPTLALGDEDRETYEAIGESDRMTLRFVKPAQ